jgi:ribonuclease HIII
VLVLRARATVAEDRASAYDGTSFVKPITSYTCKLDDAQARSLEQRLRDSFQPREVPYARFAAAGNDVNVVFYESGKLVVQGKGTQEFVEFILEPEILGEARLGYEEALQPELLEARVGVDESGKGDFFGPLCVAGVYVNESVIRAWQELGVRDSKRISSDRKIAELAEAIRGTPGCVVSVVPIGNEAYNRLHTKMGSVNRVLAWGHARVIENLLGQTRLEPPPKRVVLDQFAATESTVQRALMAHGRGIEVVQRHKAESDLAVAAASILARHEFVTRLKRLEETAGVKLPKGASAAVEAAGREVFGRQGTAGLAKVAKMHFRTAYRVQGLPEPPKVEWSARGSSRRAGGDIEG